jgi:hypothetical protein
MTPPAPAAAQPPVAPAVTPALAPAVPVVPAVAPPAFAPAAPIAPPTQPAFAPPGLAYAFAPPFHMNPGLPPGFVDPRAFAPALMGGYPYAAHAPAPPPWLAAPSPHGSPAVQSSGSPLADLMQALQTGAIPRVSGFAPPPAPGAGASQLDPSGARPARDATALLSMILSNPQVQDTLRRAALQRAPENVQLTLPAATGGARRDVVPLPMNAVVQAIAALANRSTLELDEAVADEGEYEDAPAEFLLSESGDLLVDPADPYRRADLVAHYFRCAAEAERSGF